LQEPQGYYKLIAMLWSSRFTLLVLAVFSFIQLPCLADYVDVPKGHWAEASVKRVTQDYQIMSGYPGNKFSGSANLTRYEAASIINKLFDNFGKEFDKDRADLSSLLEVMELFQGEMKTAKDDLKKKDLKIEELSRTLGAVMSENQRLSLQFDSLNTELQAVKMKEAAKEESAKKKKKGFFSKKNSAKKIKKKDDSVAVKKEEKKEKKVKDKKEIKQIEEQTSTINKELPSEPSSDYVDEYQK